MPTRWTHITINCSNLDASVDFYTSLCGLSIVRDRRLEGRHNVWLGPATTAGEKPGFFFGFVSDEGKNPFHHFRFSFEHPGEICSVSQTCRHTKFTVSAPM